MLLKLKIKKDSLLSFYLVEKREIMNSYIFRILDRSKKER